MIDVIKRNNVNVRGKGNQAILFAHGFGCDQNMWRYIIPAFEEDYKIILLDLVGAGNSDLTAYNPQKYNSLVGHAEDINEICEFLNLTDVIFVGHSVSAMIGVLAEIRSPKLYSSLILIGPSPCYINKDNYVGGFSQEDIHGLIETMEANYMGWSESLAPAIMGRPDKPELGEELTESFCRTDPTIAKHFAKVTFLSDNRADLPKVASPCLILQCSEDIIAPEVVGRYVHEQLSESTLYVMEASGHCPHMSAPEETIAFIKKFLAD